MFCYNFKAFFQNCSRSIIKSLDPQISHILPIQYEYFQLFNFQFLTGVICTLTNITYCSSSTFLLQCSVINPYVNACVMCMCHLHRREKRLTQKHLMHPHLNHFLLHFLCYSNNISTQIKHAQKNCSKILSRPYSKQIKQLNTLNPHICHKLPYKPLKYQRRIHGQTCF